MSERVVELSLEPRQMFHSDNVTYRVIERVGVGGNSGVYICQATGGAHRGLLFAAKFMVNVAREDRVARFENELKFLRSANHPAILKVFDDGAHTIGSSGNKVEVPFYISEYLPRTLRDSMRAGMKMVEKVTVALNMLSALMYISDADVAVVHRDIKPENILFRGGSAVLGDFGLLKALNGKAFKESFDMGALSKGIRNPYMYPTPELIEYAKDDKKPLCGKSDIFQLGLVFSELFCGVHPLKPREKPFEEIVMEGVPDFNGSNSMAIRPLIIEMLNFDVERRQTAAELYDRWEGVFAGVVDDARRLEGSAFAN